MTWKYITEQSDLDSILPTLMSRDSWGYDTETSGLDPHVDKVNLMQIGCEEMQFVIDTRKVNPEPLRPFFENKNIRKVIHNAKFDYKMTKGSFGLEIESPRDTYLAEKILTVGRKFKGFGLDDVLSSYLDIQVDKTLQKSFINHQGDFSQAQLQYAADDVKHLLPLNKKMSRELFENGLHHTYVLESQCVPCFGDMEMHGILLNVEGWKDLVKKNCEAAEAYAEEMNGFVEGLELFPRTIFNELDVNYNSPEQVLKILQRMNVKVKELDHLTGKEVLKDIDGTDDKTFKRIVGENAFVKLLKKYRGHRIRVTTFGNPFLEAIHKKTGRIHPDFDQIGAETGRITAGHSPVNLLNIPRDKTFRNYFIAPEDYLIETDDYSGCELRIWAHISQDPGLCDALRRGIDLHCKVASDLYNVPVSKTENGHLRTPAKTLNFGGL